MSAAGLELGETRAAFARVAVRGVEVRLLSAALVELDPSARADERAGVLRRALDGARARPAAGLTLGVSGRDAIVRYLPMPVVPPWRLKLLMEHEVRDVEERAGEPLSSDWRLLETPDAIAGAEGERTVVIGLAKEVALAPRVTALGQAGIHVARAAPGSLALFNAYVGLGLLAEGKTVALVDAGREGAELAIVRDGALIFARTLAYPPGVGGGALDEHTAQQLAGAVAGSASLAKSQRKLVGLAIDEVMVSGAHARSEALRAAFRQAFRSEPGVFDPIERIGRERVAAEIADETAARGPELAIAVGLALGGLHPRTVALDLVPRAEKARREFLTRTVFLFAGGAAIAIALVVAGTSAMIARSDAVSRRAALRGTLDEVTKRRDALLAERAANRRTEAAIDALTRRTRPGASLLRLLERLRAATVARITIAEVALEEPRRLDEAAARASNGAPSAAIGLRMKGEVDNAAGDADDLLTRLESGLKADPAVLSARVTGTSPLGAARLEFTMAVAMRAQPAGEP